MTIPEYKEKFIELAKQLEEEHGLFNEIRVESTISEIGGALEKPYIRKISRLSVEIDF